MNCRAAQRGQATSEFIAAMALFIPLLLAVIYSGKYADIKHQAIQASRYAAMQRALDPRALMTDSVVENGTVARFFRDGAAHDIGFDDRAQGNTDGDENPNWGQLSGAPLIAQYQDVEVTLGQKSVSSAFLIPVDITTGLFFNDLKESDATQADVKVRVANIPNFPGMDHINLFVRATTVIAGNSWDAGGATDVKNHIGLAVPATALKIINDIPGINGVFDALAGAPAPVIGCIKADVVPDQVAPGAKYNYTDPCN